MLLLVIGCFGDFPSLPDTVLGDCLFLGRSPFSWGARCVGDSGPRCALRAGGAPAPSSLVPSLTREPAPLRPRRVRLEVRHSVYLSQEAALR